MSSPVEISWAASWSTASGFIPFFMTIPLVGVSVSFVLRSVPVSAAPGRFLDPFSVAMTQLYGRSCEVTMGTTPHVDRRASQVPSTAGGLERTTH